jgi:hypothetical protein
MLGIMIMRGNHFQLQELLDSIMTAAKIKEHTGGQLDAAYVTITHEGLDKMRHVLAPFIHAQR